MALTLTLVRHAESESNVTGRWQGQGDSPLSEAGRRQAALFARRFADRRFDRILTSDLSRAADTAAALGRHVETEPDLREIDVGEWEGLTRLEVKDRFRSQIASLRAGRTDVPIGGGESWDDLAIRVGRCFERIREQTPSGSVLVVTHGGVIATLVAGLLGVHTRVPRPLGRVSNTAFTTLRLDGDSAELVTFNDHAHVSPLAPWVVELVERGSTAVSLVAGRRELSDAERSAFSARNRIPLEAKRPEGTLRDAIASLARSRAGSSIGVLATSAEIREAAQAFLGGAFVVEPEHTSVGHVVVTRDHVTLAGYNVGLPR